MGCFVSKDSPKSHLPREVNKSADAETQDARASRARRLSQTVFDAEQITDEATTITVPVPIAVGEDTRPQRKRKDRRSSYVQFEVDARSVIAEVASGTLAGAEAWKPKRNQDAILVHMEEDCCLFAVFDGHGQHGHHCSNFIKNSLSAVAKIKLLKDIPTADAVIEALSEAESAMLKANFDCALSGTTATVVMLQASRCILAWLGDSPGYLITQSGAHSAEVSLDKMRVTELVSGHDFSNPIERDRIVAAGGRVMRWEDEGDWLGPLRVFLPQAAMPGLNMSRSLGDATAHKIGVSSEPDTSVIAVDPSHKYLVLGSDGLDEFLSKEEILNFVVNSSSTQEACDALIKEARVRWQREENGTSDDISVIIVKLQITSNEAEFVAV